MKKLFLILLTVAAIPAFAEDTADEKSGSDADLYVNVTAARELKATESIPAAVTVISKEDMEGHSVTEALSIYAGIGFWTTYGDSSVAGQPVIRGFSNNSQGKVLVMIDGVKLNNPDMSAINWLSIPEERIERIEVIKGGNSALYGDNAVAAVINVITSVPEKGVNISADINGGNFSTLEESVSASGSNELAYIDLAAKNKKTDGYRDRSAVESLDFSVKAGVKPVDKLKISTSFIYNNSEYELPSSLTKAQYNDDPTQSTTDNDQIESDFMQISGNINYGINDRSNAEINTAYSKKSDKWDSYGYKDIEIDIYKVNPSYNLELPGVLWGTSFKIGMDYSYNKLNLIQYSDEERKNETAENGVNRTDLGFFLRFESYILENLVLSTSIRKEMSKLDTDFETSSIDNDISHSPFVYGAGLSYIFAENSKVYFSYNKLFRYPFFDEQVNYIDDTYAYPLGLVDDLDPEKGDSFEVGVDYNSLEYFAAGMNVFCTFMEDEIAGDYVLQKNVNLDETIHYGAETHFKIMPIKEFSTIFNYNYTVAEYRKGTNKSKSLTLVPTHTYSIIPEANLLNDKLKIYSEFSYTGEQFESGDDSNSKDKMDSYFLTNAGISINQKYKKADIKVYMDIDNLFDVSYVPLIYWGNYYPGSGREITVGTKVSF